MLNCVFNETHLMLGIDFHVEALPSTPQVLMNGYPHFTCALLNWVLPPGMADNVLAGPGRAMQRATDVQAFIPHIPLGPGIFYVLIHSIFSGSKSEFAVARVLVKGSPVAAAV